MKNDNRGVTLVELLIAITILMIVTGVVAGFINSGTSSFNSISANVNLQVESQLAMNQLGEYIIDCNGGVCFTDKTLYVLCSEDDGSWSCYRFRFDSNAKVLYYSSGPVTADAEGTTVSFAADSVLTDYVTAFSAAPASDSQSVALSISYAYRAKTFTGEQTISLRNQITAASTLEQLLSICA